MASAGSGSADAVSSKLSLSLSDRRANTFISSHVSEAELGAIPADPFLLLNLTSSAPESLDSAGGIANCGAAISMTSIVFSGTGGGCWLGVCCRIFKDSGPCHGRGPNLAIEFGPEGFGLTLGGTASASGLLMWPCLT